MRRAATAELCRLEHQGKALGEVFCVLAPLVGHLFASDPEQRVVRERGKDLIELLLAARFVAELGTARGETRLVPEGPPRRGRQRVGGKMPRVSAL
jgi:hypothetical protein